VQISKNEFVRFTYDPDYLKPQKYCKTISDTDSICAELNINTIKSNLKVDGGNVVCSNKKVILCDKVFEENDHISEKEVIQKLEKSLRTDCIYFVPQEPGDIIGHADGMLRFVSDDLLLINDLSGQDKYYQRSFRMALKNAGFNYIELPYNPCLKTDSATGLYINYLLIGNDIFIPQFGRKEDVIARRVLEDCFHNHSFHDVLCNELAMQGGVLNCISWNILMN
jgi:agmatine deiminase